MRQTFAKKLFVSLSVFLSVLFLFLIIEGVIRESITISQASLAKVKSKVEINNFVALQDNKIELGYLLNSNNTAVVKATESMCNYETVSSTCNVLTTNTDLMLILNEWCNETLKQTSTFTNIVQVQQVYNQGYIGYVLADMPCKQGNKVYTVPFWAVCCLQPIQTDSNDVVVYSKNVIQTIIGTCNIEQQKIILAELFQLYGLNWDVTEFLTVCENDIMHVPVVTWQNTPECFFEYDSARGEILEYRSQDKDAPMEVYIPEKIYGTQVRIIGEDAFYKYNKANSITKIVLPDGLERIETGAFQSCTSLTEIEIPDSVVYIGEGAFSGCTALKTVYLSDNLKELPNKLFNGCTELITVNIPQNLQRIHTNTFNGCSQLKIVVPDNVEVC